MTLLRCGKVRVERLQLATAEVAAFIPPTKTHLLREIYRVATEEEKFRDGLIPGSTQIPVLSSADVSPASDEAPSPSYLDPQTAGVAQLGIPQMQRPPSRPRSAQPSFAMDDINTNPFNQMPSAKRQKTRSPQGPPTQHIMNYPNPNPMYQPQYYNPFQLGPEQPHQQPNLTHSQSQILYPTHGNQNLRYQQEIKSAPAGQQQFYVFHHDFPSPPPSGGFSTAFPHEHAHQQQQGHHPHHPHSQTPTSATAPTSHSFGTTYIAAQQLSSLRETALQPSGGNTLPEPQPTPQHSTSSYLNPRSSPYMPTPLRGSGVHGTGVSTGPNVSFSEFLNSPMTAGPAPASDGGAVPQSLRRGEKRRASEDDLEEDSDDEGTIEDRSPTKKA